MDVPVEKEAMLLLAKSRPKSVLIFSEWAGTTLTLSAKPESKLGVAGRDEPNLEEDGDSCERVDSGVGGESSHIWTLLL